MTTEKMEVYSLEVGDQILLWNDLYRIIEIEDGYVKDYLLYLVDEAGEHHKFEADYSDKLRLVVVDNSEAVV